MPENVSPPDPLFHPESTNPSMSSGNELLHYNRDLFEYEAELDFKLKIEALKGKTVLDIGSGAYERFGRTAREMGVHVVSLNPALTNEADRQMLGEAIDHDAQEARDRFKYEQINRNWLGRLRHRNDEPGVAPSHSVAALGQALPFANESFDAVVSVYGVPHYLHHVDPKMKGDRVIIESYTPEIQAEDKELITDAFREILRVLKPGGKAYLTDDYRGPDQNTDINVFSPSDGTEVVESLGALNDKCDFEITEREMEDKSIKRVIVMTKRVE